MMKKLADEWARDYFDNPEKRRQGGHEIPRQIADFLADGSWKRDLLASDIRAFWQQIHEERGNDLRRGWPELAAGVLVAAELVDRKLLREFRPIDPRIEQLYRNECWRFARYALLVGDKAQPQRVFVHRGSVDDEKGRIWQLDGMSKEALDGGSHTLMIELIAREQLNRVLLPLDRAVAATGVLDDTGMIGCVRSLAEKCRAWFEHEPKGLLITAPPESLDTEEWKAVVLRQPGKDARSTIGPLNPDERKACEQAWDLWITAASMEELCAKLELRFGRGLGEVRAWNGEVIEAAQIAPLTMKWGIKQAHQKDKMPVLPLEKPFVDAVWHVVKNAQTRKGPRGVLVEGAPGAGKSLWSKLVQREFATGPLGALGYAVRVGARQLVDAFHQLPASGDWLEVLPSSAEEQRSLQRRLRTSGRLIVIVDGLDELAEPDIHRVAELLQHSGCAFIVTSRPLDSMSHAFADALRVVIEPLTLEASMSILKAHGREDLAKQLGTERNRPPAALETLCQRPFTLSLLMGAISRGASVYALTESELYRLTYQFLIQRAHQAGRLDEAQAYLLERAAGELVGELALSWLRGSDGYIRDALMSTQLCGHGMSLSEAARARRALERGYLLVRAPGGWEFAHRILAEWAAAQALNQRVLDTIRRREDDSRAALSEEQKIDIEMAEIGWLFEDQDFYAARFNEQILRFYAPLALAPERLFQALVGRSAMERLRARFQEIGSGVSLSVVSAQWSFALDIVASATWRDSEAVQRCWGIVARALLMPNGLWPFAEEQWRMFRGMLNEGAIKRFVQSMTWHLPGDMDALIALAAQTDEQRQYLKEDPTRLIRLCPPQQEWIFQPLRTDGTFEQQRVIILWELWWHHEARQTEALFVAAPYRYDATHDRLARELPRHIEKADNFYYDYDGQGDPDARGRRRRVLVELERLVYERTAQMGREISWPVLRRRLQDWPGHLQDEFLAWFTTRATAPREPFSMDDTHRLDPVERRRQGLSLFLAQIAEAHHWLEQHASLFENIIQAYPEAFASVPPEEMAQEQSSRSSFVDKAFWAWDKAGCPGELKETLWRASGYEQQQRNVPAQLRSVVKKLANSDWFDEVVGALWEVLPPGSVEANALFSAMVAAERIAAQVPLSAILATLTETKTMIPESWWQRVRWHDEHKNTWHELAQRGRGRERFLALQWCAGTDGTPLSEAFSLRMGQGDPTLDALLLAWWQHWARTDKELEFLPPDYLVDARAMPLRYRAMWSVEGWRDELLDRLHQPDAATLLDAVMAFLRAEDRNLIASIVPWLGKWALSLNSWTRLSNELLAREDLPALLAIEHVPSSDFPFGGVSAQYVSSIPLDNYWMRMGAAAHELVLATWQQRKQDMLACKDMDERVRDVRARWIEVLRQAAILTGIARCRTVDELVDLAFRVLGNDPDWRDRWTGTEIRCLCEALQSRTDEQARAPGSDIVQPLARLFEHPIPDLQYKALALCLPLAAAHERASLLLHAIRAHFRCTYHDAGTDIALGLACHEFGVPHPRGRQGRHEIVGYHYSGLMDKARRYITVAHRGRLREWLADERAELRYVACSWIGEVGVSSWTADLYAVMNDAHPAVALAAVYAWCRIAPGGLGRALGRLQRSNWRAGHYALFASYWLGSYGADTKPWWRVSRSMSEPLASELIVRITHEACTQLLQSQGQDEVGLLFLTSKSNGEDRKPVLLIEQLMSLAAQHSAHGRPGTALAEMPLRAWAESIPADGPLAELRPVIERVIAQWLPNHNARADDHAPAQESAASSTSNSVAAYEQVPAAPSQDTRPEPSLHEERFSVVWTHFCRDVFPPEWT